MGGIVTAAVIAGI